MHAIIVSIGDELALGQTVDTNSAWLAARLAALGIPCLAHHTVADDQPAIATILRQSAEAAELVLVTGGLGPTDDDLTRQALADALGTELVLDDASLAEIQAFFASRGREMADRNRVQAMCPRGASMVPNHHGTAPGLSATLGKARVFVMPGVPREMRAMYQDAVEPVARTLGGGARVILTTKINTFGWGESNVAEKLGELMSRTRNPTVGTTVAGGIVSVRVRSVFPTAGEAEEQLEDTLAILQQQLGPICFGRDEQTLQSEVVRILTEQGKTVATAESCTGGLVGAMLTDVPGVSGAYHGGWTTYTNDMKAGELGVGRDLLHQHGAVSEPVVRAMARGALTRAKADYAISVSGIAGPGGGSDEKPVGTVWIGIARRDAAAADGIHTDARLARLHGNRTAIRDRAAKTALQLLRLTLLGEPHDWLQWTQGKAATCPGG